MSNRSDHSDQKKMPTSMEEAASANKLLERPPEEDYINEWTALLTREKEAVQFGGESSVMIFRLGGEWLAISILVFSEVAEWRLIHRIPHRSGQLLMGIVNLRGQLLLCINMQNFLEIESEKTKDKHKGVIFQRRMVAIHKEEDQWILPVDEVLGIGYCDLNRLENVPVTVAKSAANYLKGVFTWKQKTIGYLDEELLFYSLRRKLL